MGQGQGPSFSNEAELLLVNAASLAFHSAQMQAAAEGSSNSNSNSMNNSSTSSSNVESNGSSSGSSSSLKIRAANFRPNLVVSGAAAHTEDSWTRVAVLLHSGQREAAGFAVQGPCQRCSVINVNGATGAIDGRALAALAGYRRKEGGSLHFGLFLAMDAVLRGRVEAGEVVLLTADSAVEAL